MGAHPGSRNAVSDVREHEPPQPSSAAYPQCFSVLTVYSSFPSEVCVLMCQLVRTHSLTAQPSYVNGKSAFKAPDPGKCEGSDNGRVVSLVNL